MHSPLGGKPGWQLAIDLVCVALQALVWIAAVAYGGEQFPATRRLRFAAVQVVGGALRAPLVTVNQRVYSAADFLALAAAVAALWLAVSLFTRVVSMRLMRATGASRGNDS